MIRLITYILFSLALTLGITWLLAVPGIVQIDLAGYRIQPRIGVFSLVILGIIALAIFLFSLIRRVILAPKSIQKILEERRQNHGIEALSNALIALQAGDAQKTRQLARDAQNKLPQNAAAQLLEARAQLALGEWGQAREQYRHLIDNPKTTLAALSGLYEQAKAQNSHDAALTFAQKAYSLDPQLNWASDVIFEHLTRQGDWIGALKIVNEEQSKNKEEKLAKKRRLAVLHSAIAQKNELVEPDDALNHARIALKLLPEFVPPALIAARLYSNRGEIRKASSLLRRVWSPTKHPHIALLFANAQPGISPTERLKRLQDLIPNPPQDQNSAIIIAQTAIKAKNWLTARNVLVPFIGNNPSKATCVAMAEIEDGQNLDQGKARQWLSRAVLAPLDPVWVADGVTANEWAPVSPITGKLDRFEFKVPTSTLTNNGLEFDSFQTNYNDHDDTKILADKDLDITAKNSVDN